jgi:transcriptional regulator with XRE-family HTH domain
MQHKKILANELKILRENQKLTQGEVAEFLGYSTAQFVSNWERGVSTPPMGILKTLAKKYNKDPEYLFSLIEKLEIEKCKISLKKRFALAKVS